MKQKNAITFLDGMRDSIPVAIVYFVVSFTFGVTIAKYGFPAWYSTLLSAINFTSVGQFTGTRMMVESAAIYEIGLAILVVNLRYILCGISISQKLDTKNKLQRMLMGMFIADEIYAVIANKKKVTFKYYMGLVVIPYICWLSGSTCGAYVDALLPERLQASMGIALFCMFIGIIIPPAMRDKRLFLTIGLSSGLSCLFYFTPYLNKVSFGFRIVIAAVISAAVSALLFPIETIDDDSEYTRDEQLSPSSDVDLTVPNEETPSEEPCPSDEEVTQ